MTQETNEKPAELPAGFTGNGPTKDQIDTDKNMNNDNVKNALLAPFPANEIEWRMAQAGLKNDGTPWGKCLAYVTNRAIQKRLDDTFGPFGWRNEFRFEQIERGAEKLIVCLCGISVFDGSTWVTKWDGAEPTDIESGKGAISDAMKRAAVQWGIGRYLYNLEEGWAVFRHDGIHNAKMKDGSWHRWSPPELPAWALPSGASAPTEAPDAAPAPSARSTPPAPRPAAPTTPAPSAAREQASPPAPQPSAPPAGRSAAPASAAAADSSVNWRDVVVPPFIKKYAGQTLADMEPKDIVWWAENYEPRPFKGKIQPKDVALKRALVAGAKERASEDHSPLPPVREPEPATVGGDDGDDVPY